MTWFRRCTKHPHPALSLLFAIGVFLTADVVHARTAFYYGADVPVAELGAYDRVVLQPGLVSPGEVAALKAAGASVYAYVSVGEIEPADSLFNTLPNAALPGSNPAWNTRVADLTHAAWRTHILEDRLAPLSSSGFDGAFLDTLDSHHLLENIEVQRAALVTLISEIQRRYSELSLLLNRGFEILADLDQPVAGVVAESLYHGWNGKEYRVVPPEDRQWLLDRLAQARPYADELVVIDYLPFAAQEERRGLARKIEAAGFDAWVAEPSLRDLGTSDLVPVPRRLLVIHGEKEAPLTERDVHVMFGVIFDWLGYVVEYHDVRDGPPVLMKGVHAGVISWLDASVTEELSWFENWLMQLLEDEYPLVLLATLPSYSDRVLDALGLEALAPDRMEVEGVVEPPVLVGNLEAPLRIRRYEVPPVRSVNAANDVDLALRTNSGEVVSPVLTAPWGGMALHPYIVEDYGEGRRRWLLDPYSFLTAALGYTPRPVLDTTTESGSRLLTVHIDGDGFPSRAFVPGSPLSADVLRETFIQGYELPHTVSIIEGEISANGLYPEQSDMLETAARKIFAEPNVEVASHSFSHPFYWRPDVLRDDQPLQYGMNLPLEGYEMSLEREIAGSIDYINERLSPAGKRVKVFLWTGSADPDEHALEMLEDRGVLNVNGGNTNVVAADESLLNVWPQARLEGNGLQVYAPAMNENVYTNNWTGPFYGYRKAIETFRLTDHPRRLKPISIYYHFYSATKPASIRALHEVYAWALGQEVLPIYLSEYSRRVRDFHHAWIYRDLDDNWVVGDMGALRTIRLPDSMGYPDPIEPGSVAGWRTLNSDRYLHTLGDHAHFSLAATPAQKVSLVSANAHIERWVPAKDSVELRIRGFLPVRFSIRSSRTCRLELEGGTIIQPESTGQLLRFDTNVKDTGDARLVCR